MRPGAIDPDRAAHPDRADIGIDGDLGEHGTEGVHRIAARHFGIGLRGRDSLDRLAGARHDVRIGLSRRGIAAAAQAAVVPLDAVELRAEDLRALVRDGALRGFLLHRDAGGADRRADRRHGHRSAVRGRGREIGAAKSEADLRHRHTQHVRRNLRHRRVSAWPHVARRRLDLDIAAGKEPHAGAGREVKHRIGAGRHAPADQEATVAHRARRVISPRPAEALGAEVITFHQGAT